MRIATYNVEWFNALFDNKGRLLEDGAWSSRYNITRNDQITALGIVFTALDADAIMVIEAPDQNGRRATVPALETFAKRFDLRAKQAVIGFENDTQQEIALMFDPYVLSARHDPVSAPTGLRGGEVPEVAPRFDGEFHIDLDVDATEDVVRFSKPPLELAMQTATGVDFRMIGAHLKSKAPHGASNPDEVMQLSIANRRKQLAQAIWLRRRVVGHLQEGTPLIVLGDMNDGPGLDEYEDLFGRSSIEIVMGDGDGAPLFDPHAKLALSSRIGATPTSARFYIDTTKTYLQALLDYIMVSPDLAARGPTWRIWHPFDDPKIWAVPELRDALLMASDHFPVTLDIDL